MSGFYDLPKDERDSLVRCISDDIYTGLSTPKYDKIVAYFADDDTYIRKSAYIAIGRIYFSHISLRNMIIELLQDLFSHDDYKVRQTAINAAGEIGKIDFAVVESFFDEGIFDKHHSPRNAVIGSIKKMGEVNPLPVIAWSRKYLHHPDKQVRREMCHGIELRGRKYPQDILPLLRELQHDKTARVRNTLVHVLGQIAYKKGCLATVIAGLKTWDNKQLVADAIEEIIDVHHRYRNFSAMTQDEARSYIAAHYS
jgi:3-methyladenine DNA glycosylase AlkC